MPLRTFQLNDPEFHKLMVELREREEGTTGELPRDPKTWERRVIVEPNVRLPLPYAGEGRGEGPRR